MTRHELDLFSLLSGLTLTGIALVALLGVDLDVAAWAGPALLIGLGIAVLATILGSDRASDEAGEVDGGERTEVMAAAPAEADEVEQVEHVEHVEHTAD